MRDRSAAPLRMVVPFTRDEPARLVRWRAGDPGANLAPVRSAIHQVGRAAFVARHRTRRLDGGQWSRTLARRVFMFLRAAWSNFAAGRWGLASIDMEDARAALREMEHLDATLSREEARGRAASAKSQRAAGVAPGRDAQVLQWLRADPRRSNREAAGMFKVSEGTIRNIRKRGGA